MAVPLLFNTEGFENKHISLLPLIYLFSMFVHINPSILILRESTDVDISVGASCQSSLSGNSDSL